MTTVAEAAADLEAALKGVEGVRVYMDPSAVVEPPGLVVSAPALAFEGYGDGITPPTPSNATFPVYVVARADDRFMSTLWDLVPTVMAALESVADVVTPTADPGAYNSGGVQLPCYEILAEMSL